MPENINRTKGRPAGYKFDRGGTPTESGPVIGIVKNNVDPARSGRLQVYVEQFGGEDETDESLWRTVNYIPPFYGVTPGGGSNGESAGTFTGNQQSYGMWFTPPDLGTQVICFFVTGDPNQGYYLGCVPDPAINHMLPAIGASRRFELQNGPQDSYFAGASQLPVTEINNENQEIAEDPRFFDKVKPVHSYVAGIMMQQGLIRDTVRGPITSNAQRESPSAVFGISTPGQAIYQGGLNERDIKGQLERGLLKPQDVQVIARRGGHSIVLDDGDLEGRDNLVRIRTAKGHQHAATMLARSLADELGHPKRGQQAHRSSAKGDRVRQDEVLDVDETAGDEQADENPQAQHLRPPDGDERPGTVMNPKHRVKQHAGE